MLKMEFSTEEEMREYLGKDAKGYDVKSGFVGLVVDTSPSCPDYSQVVWARSQMKE